jgi:hypothetical protein
LNTLLKAIKNHSIKISGIAVTGFLIVLSYYSEGLSGGSDSYGHFLIAKNAWSHPELILDQWGKPLYTIIAMPFAQFGIHGIILLNIICLIGSGFFAYRIAVMLQFKFAYMAFLLTVCSPVFLDNTISSLTEPLCAFLVIWCVYLHTKSNYTLSAIMASLLPFARSEGFIVLFVFSVVIILVQKRYYSIPLLFSGSIIFNTLGWIIQGDPFWVISQNPYINFELSGNNICGNGGLFHYLYAGHYTFGFFVCILLAGSIPLILGEYFRNEEKRNSIYLLISGIFLGYFGAHVFIWWKGMMGSCGYVRVMTVIVPLVSLLVVYVLHKSTSYINIRLPKNGSIIMQFIVILFVLNTIYTPFRYYAYKYPLTLTEEQKQYNTLHIWYQETNYQNRTKIYLRPYFSIIANIDPYNKNEHLDFWASSLQFSKKDDILIWDSHFGPYECGIPLIDLEKNKDWKKIKKIIPTNVIPTVNNLPFEIHVFEKIN